MMRKDSARFLTSPQFAAAAAGALAAALAALVLVAVLAMPAFAADENVVNPQQRPDSSFIYDTPLSALFTADAYFDGQTVQVVGEAIGDAVNAEADGSQKWITLSAEEQGVTSSVSVYMTDDQASRIDTFGRYGATGTSLQVRGVFHLVCPDHEGITDIHAEVVSVVDQGSTHADGFDPKAFIPGAIVVLVGLAMMGVFYYLRERQR